MAIVATGAGVRAGMATQKVVICRVCGAKTAVPRNMAGKIACGGCAALHRVGRTTGVGVEIAPPHGQTRGKGVKIRPTDLQKPPPPRNPRSPGGSRAPETRRGRP